MSQHRWYWKCIHCQEPFVIEDRDANTWEVWHARCPWCNRSLTNARLLGKVKGNRWVKEVALTACDDRCQSAQGPTCECKCRGEHHGRTYLVTVVCAEGRVRIEPAGTTERIRTRALHKAQQRDAALDVLNAVVKEVLKRGGSRWLINWAEEAARLSSPKSILRRAEIARRELELLST